MLSLAVLWCAPFVLGDPLASADPLDVFVQEPEIVENLPIEDETWEFSLSATLTDPPDDHVVFGPIFYADRGPLHLEARWNYEDLDTGSLFAGWKFAFGDEVAFELTPMVGGVFGETDGVAPAFEFDVAWKQLEFYTEDEYVFDFGGKSDNFFYSWSTLTWSPVEWLQTGLVAERTRVYETDVDVNRGVLLGFTYENFSVVLYGYNFDEDPYVQVQLGIDF